MSDAKAPEETLLYIELVTGSRSTPVQVLCLKEGERSVERPFCFTDPRHVEELLELNEAGWNLYIVANGTNFPRHGFTNNNDITEIRVLFVDGDDIPMPEEWHVEPDFVTVKNDGRWHAYWRIDGLSALDVKELRAKFKSIQRRLIQLYGTDPVIHDPKRVIRIPGYKCWKKGEVTGIYGVVKLDAAAYPPREEWELTADLPELPPRPPRESSGKPVSEPMLRDIYANIHPNFKPDGEKMSRGEWMDLAFALDEAKVIKVDEDGRAIKRDGELVEDEDLDREKFFIDWSCGAFHPDEEIEGPDAAGYGDISDFFSGRHHGDESFDKVTIGTAIEMANKAGAKIIPRVEGAGGSLRERASIPGQVAVSQEMLETLDIEDVSDEVDDISDDERYYVDLINGYREEKEKNGGWISMAEMVTTDYPRAEFLIDPFIIKGRPQLITGDGGLGKTTLICQAAVAIAAGKSIFDLEVMQSSCMLYLCEDNEGEIKHRLIQAAEDIEEDLLLLPIEANCRLGKGDNSLFKVEDDGDWSPGPMFLEFMRKVDEYRPGFIFLDTVTESARLNGNLDIPVNRLINTILNSVCKIFGTTILFSNHPSKASKVDGTYSSGSVKWQGSVRSHSVVKGKEGSTFRTWELGKANYRPQSKLHLSLGDGLFTMGAKGTARDWEEVRAVFEAVEEMLQSDLRVTQSARGSGHGPASICDAVRDKFGMSLDEKTVRAHLSTLERMKRLEYESNDKNTRGTKATYKLGPRASERWPTKEGEEDRED